jgi:hypothetical protein
VKRRPHSGHCRRRRMLEPSSVARESMTRESVWRQNGQCISDPLAWRLRLGMCVDERWTLVLTTCG